MKDETSSLLQAIVTLAAQEAVNAGQPEITPAHLLIALSRFSEPQDEVKGDPTVAAVSQLQQEFRSLGIDPRQFRRRLRALIGSQDRPAAGGMIHRSPSCKAVFSRADLQARNERVALQPLHLLRAALLGEGVEVPQSLPKEGASPGDDIPAEL